MLEITPALVIPDEEVRFETSRSSGPGGQNVNKVESRVALLFDLEGSRSLSEEQKRRAAARLGSRINRDGVLRVVSQRHRTQAANRRAATLRFLELLAEALKPPRARKEKHKPAAAKRRRLEAKRRRAQVKALRAKPRWEG